MAITVTQRPLLSIPSTSRWNGVGNPIVYKFTRKDFTFTQINSGAGATIEIQINGSDQTANFNVGDQLWLESDNGVYSLAVTCDGSVFSLGNTFIATTSPYISAAPGGYVNNNTLRAIYKLNIDVYSGTNVIGTLAYSDNRKGEIIANVSSPIWSQLSADNDLDLTGTTEAFDDLGAYLSFYIKYTEVWFGSDNSETSDSANVFYAVYGARQIPSTYGGNYLEYVSGDGSNILNDSVFNVNWTNEGVGINWNLDPSVLITTVDVAETSKRARRSITLDSGNTYSINLQFSGDAGAATTEIKVYLSNGQSVSFGTFSSGSFNEVRNIEITSSVTYLEIEAVGGGDTNEIIISDVIVNLVATIKFLTRLTTPVMWRDWPFLLSVIVNEYVANNVYLEVGSDTSASADQSGKLVDYDLNQILTDQTVSTVDVTLFEDSTPDVQLSEVLTVELRTECDNPVMLLGRNSLGGCLQWMFDFSQEYTFDYGNNIKAKRHLLFAKDLTLNQWEALNDFFTLGQVYRNNIVEFTSSTNKTSSRIGQQVYVLNQDGTKIGVIVIPTKNVTNTRQVKHTFEIEIEYPETFTT